MIWSGRASVRGGSSGLMPPTALTAMMRLTPSWPSAHRLAR